MGTIVVGGGGIAGDEAARRARKHAPRGQPGGMEWRLSWTSRTNVKIRDPVWSKVKAEEA